MTKAFQSYAEARLVATGLVDQTAYIINGDYGNEIWTYDADDTSADNGVSVLEPAQGGAFRRDILGENFMLTDGTAVVATPAGKQVTAWWNPASGDSVQVRYKVASSSPFRTLGVYTTAGEDTTIGKVFQIEFQRTAGSGTTSTCGVV